MSSSVPLSSPSMVIPALRSSLFAGMLNELENDDLSLGILKVLSLRSLSSWPRPEGSWLAPIDVRYLDTPR